MNTRIQFARPSHKYIELHSLLHLRLDLSETWYPEHNRSACINGETVQSVNIFVSSSTEFMKAEITLLLHLQLVYKLSTTWTFQSTSNLKLQNTGKFACLLKKVSCAAEFLTCSKRNFPVDEHKNVFLAELKFAPFSFILKAFRQHKTFHIETIKKVWKWQRNSPQQFHFIIIKFKWKRTKKTTTENNESKFFVFLLAVLGNDKMQKHTKEFVCRIQVLFHVLLKT